MKAHIKSDSALFCTVCFFLYLWGGCTTAQEVGKANPGQEANRHLQTQEANKIVPVEGSSNALVEALAEIPIQGPMMEDVHGLSPNPTTEAIVSKGPSIVPALISALDHSKWTQTVWIVFCLKQLRAPEAKERIIKLQREVDNGRFANEPHDLTLLVLVEGYLDEVENPESTTNHVTGHQQ